MSRTDSSPQNELRLSFIPIGKGDCFLIEVPEDGFYLCDTGTREDAPKIKEVLHAKGVESLKAIFLTHGHKDHSGSLKKILRAFPTETVYYSGRDKITFAELHVKKAAGKRNSTAVKLYGGEIIDMGQARMEVWMPEKPDKSNENNNSVVFRLCYGETAFLLTGDMELEEEAIYLVSGVECRADVLKLGHHGEDDATSEELLERVNPEYAIITGNAEENPDSLDKTVAARLKARGMKCFYSEGEQLATDFISDGRKVRVEVIGAVLKEDDKKQALQNGNECE